MALDHAELDEAIDQSAENAYYKCKKMLEADPSLDEDVEFLWRFAKACLLWGNTMEKKNPKKRPLIWEGRDYAVKAYELDEDCFEALRWTAILCGAATEFLGIRDRIEQGKVFKGYLDKAILIDPKDFTLLHLRGRFSYEVSTLSWLERKVCNTVFSGVPECSVDEALQDFLEAEKNAENPPWAENLLFAARCYAVKKQKPTAQEFLAKVEEMKEQDEAVKEGINEVRTMVAKLK